jgi:hypothetical protein
MAKRPAGRLSVGSALAARSPGSFPAGQVPPLEPAGLARRANQQSVVATQSFLSPGSLNIRVGADVSRRNISIPHCVTIGGRQSTSVNRACMEGGEGEARPQRRSRSPAATTRARRGRPRRASLLLGRARVRSVRSLSQPRRRARLGPWERCVQGDRPRAAAGGDPSGATGCGRLRLPVLKGSCAAPSERVLCCTSRITRCS